MHLLLRFTSSAGYCFISYRDLEAAKDCINALDGNEIFSARRLRCEMARVRSQPSATVCKRRPTATAG
jgi:RNA recognition motif-containing protein